MASPDGIDRAYEAGVTMGDGSSLSQAGGEIPKFLVMALADPRSAPLQRLQIIKGWVDDAGQTHEDVIDVACAKGAVVDPETKRCP